MEGRVGRSSMAGAGCRWLRPTLGRRAPSFLSLLLLLPRPVAPVGSSGLSRARGRVFRSEGSSSYSFASSSDYSSDGGFSSCPEEDFDALEELHEVNQHDQEGEKPDLHNDGMRRTKDIIQVSESKLVIEHLLMQETFSREESDRLIEMIQSRVVDSPSMRFIEDNAGRKLLNRDTVTEARKCSEEKEMASDTNHDLVRRPYPLKADMLHQDQDEVSSPVDLAKSYMQSLQPHHSTTSLSSSRILPSQLNGLHQTKDEGTCTMANPPPSLKVFKRKYPYRRSQDDCQSLLSMSRDDGTNLMQVPLPITVKDTSTVSPVAEGAVKASALNHESSIQNIISSAAILPEIKMEPASSLGFDEDKLDVIEPLQKTRKHDGSLDVCHENLSFSSASMVLVDAVSDEPKMTASGSFQFREYSEDNVLLTLTCKDEPVTGICQGPFEHPNAPAIKISAGESHTGTRMRPLEGKLIEPSPGTTRGSRKSKARTRRGRGRK